MVFYCKSQSDYLNSIPDKCYQMNVLYAKMFAYKINTSALH